MKITTICNPNSPYYQKQVKIRQYHPNEEVEVFVLEDEALIFVPLDYLTPDSETFKPRSRKDFYEFVQNPTTSRTQMIETLKYLTSEKLLTIHAPSTELEIIDLFTNYERTELVEKFRTLRDEGILAFNLANNSGLPTNFKKQSGQQAPRSKNQRNRF